MTDTRRRLPCIYCGEPCVSDTPEDPMSWHHAPEAGDDGKHTADISIIPLKPWPGPADI
jgi:hypothetical protein